MKWITFPAPEDWPDDDNGGVSCPRNMQNGKIAYCANGHQWWSKSSDPLVCPDCLLMVHHRQSNYVEWYLHLIVEFIKGRRVYTVGDFAEHLLNGGL